APQADDDIDPRDLGPFGHLRLASEPHGIVRRIREMPLILPEVMRMIVHPRVEIGARTVDRDLRQETGGAEGTQRVVDGGERNRLAGGRCRLEQAFGSDMTVATIADEEFRKGESLPGRPQAARIEPGRRKRRRVRPVLCSWRPHEPYPSFEPLEPDRITAAELIDFQRKWSSGATLSSSCAR